MATVRVVPRTGLALLLIAQAAAAGEPSQADLAAAELWRRGHCILSSVVVPAQKASAAPQDLRGAQAVEGRTFSGKVKILSWARDERFLWAATDTDVFQIELAGRRLVRSYGKGDGLPDWPVDDLLSDGRTLWIVHRQGLAMLRIGETKVRDRDDVRFRFARLFRDDGGVWAIADDATHRFAGDGPPERLPALPTGGRITAELKTGVWLARRRQQTAYYVSDTLGIGGRLYVASQGAIFELADGAWSRVTAEGWAPQAGHGALWFLSTQGVVRYDPATKQSVVHSAPQAIPEGRPTHLVVTEKAVWTAVEPREDPQTKGFVGGGVARLDVASGKWQTWQTLNGQRADRAMALEARNGAVWATAIAYKGYRVQSAHPGMMHVTRTVPIPTGICMHRYDPATGAWSSLYLQTPECEPRRILGQRDKQSEGVMVPRIVDATAAGQRHLLGIVRLFPKDFYSGYYTSIDQLAVRRDKASPWEASYVHHPEQLNLQGEQPTVLLISESHGKRVVHGDGHDYPLALFAHGERLWAVTEGCIGWFDEAKESWQKVLETGFRFYWKAAAALDDGTHLWVGSDRGLVARLDLATGQFETLAVLRDRQITAIAAEGNRIVVAGKPAERGCLPAQLEDKLPALDCDAAAFDGTNWTAAQAPAAASPALPWRIEGNTNFLARLDPATNKPVPAYYLTGVFQPRVLCASPDGRRTWAATYSGLVRIDRQP